MDSHHAAGAYVQSLNRRGGIHLKVGVKVKLKGCGARRVQGYSRVISPPEVSASPPETQ